MKRSTVILMLLLVLGACSDRADNSERGGDLGYKQDSDQGADIGSSQDSGPLAEDAGTTRDAAPDLADADNTDASSSNDTSLADVGMDSGGAADMDSQDVGSDTGGNGGYDTTGWDMKRVTLSDSASVGTPDSYFFDVDSGSPISASIIGGGSGAWSVNVFGGYSNFLYCTGAASCQVMLRPEDTTVIVTAITTDIGSYSLTVDYAGTGLQ